MGYGYYADNEPNGSANSSYLDLLQHAQGLSVINPVWYYVQPAASGGWTLDNWTTSIGAQNGQSNVSVVTQAAHSQNVLVMPSVGIYYNPSAGPITTPAEQQALVQQLVGIVQQNNYDGLTMDFESQGAGGLSVAQASQQYTSFIQQLGTALHGLGKKLMIAVYASSYPSTIYNYAALAPYVNWINIMAYPEHNSSTPAGPTQGYPWLEGIVQNALATGVSPSQIILGVAPYGHSWTYTNSGVNPHTYESNRSIHTYVTDNNIVPLWDSREKAIVFTTGALAQTPPATLAYNVSQSLPAVANLQALLNIVLLEYANTHNQPVPPMIWAGGYYGSETTAAVTTFQQDFQVTGAQPGVYDSATAQALGQAIAEYHVGQTQWWDQTSRSFADLLKLSLQDHLAGVASWRLPFESADYWSTVSSMTTIWHE
jgi:spore germination protein YaaH